MSLKGAEGALSGNRETKPLSVRLSPAALAGGGLTAGLALAFGYMSPAAGAAGFALFAGLSAMRMIQRGIVTKTQQAALDRELAEIGPKMANSPVPRAIATASGTIVLHNGAWEQGGLPLDMIPLSWLEVVYEGPSQVVIYSESNHEFEVSQRPLRGLENHRHWMARDVTAAARVELEMFEHADLGWIEMSVGGMITFVNQTLASWLGRPAHELMSGDLSIHDIFRATEDTPGATDRFRANLVTRSGDPFPVEVVIESEDQKEGKRAALVIDLREIVRSVEALAESAERFGRFIDDAPIGIAAIASDGRIVEANPAFAEFVLGHEETAPLVGRRIVDFAAEAQDHAAAVTALDAVLAGVEGASADFIFEATPDRTLRAFAARGQFMEAPVIPENRILYLIDISAQKSLEAQFVQSQKMQAVGQLAGGIAHDFNNLLTAVIGFCDLLLVRHGPEDESFPDIMQIKQNANRAANLTRQLLAFSRRQTLLLKVIDIRNALTELSVLLRRLIGANIRLELDHAADLWLVKVDTGQFDQVIINLVVNARDAMPAGGRVLIRTRNVSRFRTGLLASLGVARGDYVMIEVADTGTGIPKDVLPNIFEPFFTTKEVGAGTGLGLSTVYGIVKQSGGTIAAESEPGQGALFRILLPRYVPASGEVVVQSEAVERTESASGSGTVLIVEDEEPVRNFAVRALKRQGYNVLEAASGEAALEIIESGAHVIDLLISDVVMPALDGPSLAARAREHMPDIKVILISGYAEDTFARSLDPKLSFVFLAKPFSLKELAETVRVTLQGA